MAYEPYAYTMPMDDGLYIGRALVNTGDYERYCRQHGIRMVPDPHVTVVHSEKYARVPVDVASVRVFPEQFGKITPLGPSGAVVLTFTSDHLTKRHDEILAAGAVSAYASYKAHLTLTYDDPMRPQGIEWDKLPLPDFPLVFGPEAAGPVWSNVFRDIFPPHEEEDAVIGVSPFFGSVVTAPLDLPPIVDTAVDTTKSWTRHPMAGTRAWLESMTPHTIAALRQAMGPGQVAKSGEEQRLVSGWALVTNGPDGRPVRDKHRDVVPLPVLAEAMKGFMAGPRVLGGLHLKDANGVPLPFGEVIETLIVTPTVKRVLQLPPRTPFGAAITAKATSDAAWGMVKAGRLRMFSIGGRSLQRKGWVVNPITAD